ncbi:hypothetical protein B14911_12187 [Bacillus sp. NRRL B-14911]|nr:hypothetical protein B14911_12187 [Bacillus sp. NRRL B-14911]
MTTIGLYYFFQFYIVSVIYFLTLLIVVEGTQTPAGNSGKA